MHLEKTPYVERLSTRAHQAVSPGIGPRGRGRPRSFPGPRLCRRADAARAQTAAAGLRHSRGPFGGSQRGWAFFACFLVVLVAGCSPNGKEPGASQETQKAAEPESRVQHGTNGEVIVSINAETAKTMGLKTAPLEKAQLPPESKAYGHVLDPAPLASLVAELISAQAAATASDAELKRLQSLAAQNNASQKALQTAQAAAVRDNAQVQSLHLRLMANWGEGIASRQDLPDFVQNLSALKWALIELNSPAGEMLPGAPTGAQLTTLSEPATPLDAGLLGRAPVTDPQLQNRGFFFLVESNSGRLGPGDAVSGLLRLPGEPVSGLAVPRAAIVQFNGAKWVYLQASEDKFQRVEIHPGQPLDDSLFLKEGLRAGDRLVTVGAQELLSEELKGQGGDE